MKYTTIESKVLKDYLLIDDNEELVQVDLERPAEHPLGIGPKLELKAIQALLQADSTPEQTWLEWIFCQAGGGVRAKEATDRTMSQINSRFIDERVNGFHNPDTKEYYPPTTREEASERWKVVEPIWNELLTAADQDAVDHLGVFGFYRAWPGKDSVYERIVKAVKQFQALAPKIAQMNAEYVGADEEPISSQPSKYETLEKLEEMNRKVERYFASKQAREDVRIEKIYEDEYLRMLCPLTYAASVRYGFDNWPFANRDTFEEVLSSDNSFRDAWKSTTTRSVLVYIYWKVPMPSWVSRKNSEFQRYELVNLAVELPHANMRHLESAALVFHDEENTSNMAIEQLRSMIMTEPVRVTDPQDDEMPIKRGPNAYATQEEANKRNRAFESAMAALFCWGRAFSISKVHTDVYKLPSEGQD
jgi:hypothetical protein